MPDSFRGWGPLLYGRRSLAMFTSLTSVSFSITRSGVLTGVAHSGAMDRRRLRLLVRDSQPSSSSQRPVLLEVLHGPFEHADVCTSAKELVSSAGDEQHMHCR